MVKQIIQKAGLVGVLTLLGVMGIGVTNAAPSTTISQTINAGTLTVDIVDASYVAVSSPGVTMGTVTKSLTLQTATGTLGTGTEQIYAKKTTGVNSGWAVSLAASTSNAVWHNTGLTASFNYKDETSSGVNGQMTVDPSYAGSVLAKGISGGSVIAATKGSSTAFTSTVGSITLMSGTSSDGDGDWSLQGVRISQTIPAQQAADTYTIPMVVSILAV